MTNQFQINREFRDLVASTHFQVRRDQQAYRAYCERFEELNASYNFTYERDNTSTEQAQQLIRDIITREDTRYFLEKNHSLIGAPVATLKAYPYRSHLIPYVAQWYAEHERAVQAHPLALPQRYHLHVVIVDRAEVQYLTPRELFQAYATIFRGLYLAEVRHLALELPRNCTRELAEQLILLARALMQGMVVAISDTGSLSFYRANRDMRTGYIPVRMVAEFATPGAQPTATATSAQATSATAQPSTVANFLNLADGKGGANSTSATDEVTVGATSYAPGSALTIEAEFAAEYELEYVAASEIVVDDRVVVLDQPGYSFLLELVAIPDNILVAHSLTSPKLLYTEHFDHIACCYAQLIHNNKELVRYIDSHGYELVTLLETIREKKGEIKDNKLLVLDLNHSSKVCTLLEALDHREHALLNQQLVALELYLQEHLPEQALTRKLEQWESEVATIADEQERQLALEDRIWAYLEAFLVRNAEDYTASIDPQYKVIKVGVNPRPLQVECDLAPGTTIAEARKQALDFAPEQARKDINVLYEELVERDKNIQTQLDAQQDQASAITTHIDVNSLKITKMHYDLTSRIRSVLSVIQADIKKLDAEKFQAQLEQLQREQASSSFWYVRLPENVDQAQYLEHLARVQVVCAPEISPLIASNYWWPRFEAVGYTRYPEARRYFLTLQRIKRGIYHVYMIDDHKSSEIALQVANFKRTGVAELLICSNDLKLFERHNYSNAVVIDTNSVSRAFARVNQHFTLREMLEVAVGFQLEVQLKLNFNAFNLYLTQFDAQTAFSLLLLPTLREVNMIQTSYARDAQQMYGYSKARNLVGQFKQLYPKLLAVKSLLNREHWITDIFYADNKEVYELLPLTGKRYQINFG